MRTRAMVSTRRALVGLGLVVAVVTVAAVDSGSFAQAASPPMRSALAALDVPLTIRDVAGIERKQEVCSTGVPLPCGLLKEPEGIAVISPVGKPVPAQFRVLERWRERGLGTGDLSVKWLLVTFLADVPRGGKAVYRLRAGTNPAPVKPVTVEETADAFRMGGLTFTRDFSGPFQLVLTDPDGKTLTAADLPVRWRIWENGPVRACLKAETPTVPGKFGFIAWIRAYAGRPRWDLTVALKNTPNKPRGPFYFKDFSVVWSPPALKGAKDYLLGGEWGTVASATLTGDETAYLYQDSDGTDDWKTLGAGRHEGYHAFTLNWRKETWEPGIPQFRGYKVLSGEKEIASGNVAQGWVGLNGSGAGALVCVRHFRQQHPKAVEVEPGRLVARLWPRYWKGHGGLHWLDDCQRKVHDLSFRLLPGPVSPASGEAASRAFDAPLVAHCGIDWYRRTGVRGFIPPDVKQVEPKVIDKQAPSHDTWITFGGDILDRIRRRYHDYPMDRFVRSGDPHRAYRTFTGMRHSQGMTPFWVDDYRHPRDKGVIRWGYCSPPRATGTYRPNTSHHGYMAWNNQHFCCRELFDGWRLFGDPLALDAARDIGTYTRFWVDYRQAGGGIGETRVDALPMSNICEAYRITGDEAYLNAARDFAAVMWKTVNKERGYYVPNRSVGSIRTRFGPLGADKPFMLAHLMNGLHTYHDLTGDETAADLITGIVDFVMAEASIGPWGFTYEIPIDLQKQSAYLTAMQEKRNEIKEVWYGRGTAPLIAWCYRYTGDERYRKRLEAFHARRKPSRWLYTNYGPARTDTTAPEAVTDIKADALGGGKVRLTWTAPAGEPARYQVKWADKPMVRRITFPQQKDTHANWWAANNVVGEPRPGAPGTKQSMVVEGVTAGERHFAIRAFDAAGNRSAISNLARVMVK